MRKMLGYVEGADFFLVFSLIIFLLFFIGVTIYLFRMDKKLVSDMEQLPLQNDDQTTKEATT